MVLDTDDGNSGESFLPKDRIRLRNIPDRMCTNRIFAAPS
jgi:hypothetical protein